MLVLALGRSREASRRPRSRRSHHHRGDGERTVSGGHGGGETPVPIPNTAVKPASADGTWGEAPWESRTPPGFLDKGPSQTRWAFVISGCHLGYVPKFGDAPWLNCPQCWLMPRRASVEGGATTK
jgi:hypothetical protein